MDCGGENPASVGEDVRHEKVHVDFVAKAMNLSGRHKKDLSPSRPFEHATRLD